MIVVDAEHVRDIDLSKDIAETLETAYPGHLWAVTVTSGIATVKSLYISSVWGMVLHYDNIKGDWAARKKAVIMAGGELLERANLRRNKYMRHNVQILEGADKYSPLR